MSNIVPFAQAPVPAHFQGGAPDESNIAPKETLPALSFRGKVWRLTKDGEEKTVMNKEGDPATSVSVVLLDYIKPRSRIFYEGQYVAGENKPPRCTSMDGKVPDPSIAEPIAKSCDVCPNSVKGSKITPAGKPTTACAQTKKIAVVPASAPTDAPYLLRLAPTSIWDKENKENEAAGWYAWDQYIAFLTGKGCTNTAQVITRIKFDHRVEYPKLLFSAARWLTPEEWAVMKTKWNAPEVKDVLYGKASSSVAEPDAAGAPDGAEDDGMAVMAQPAAAAAPAAAPAPARTRKSRETAAPAPAAVAPAPAPAGVVPEDDDSGEMSFAVAPAAAALAPAPQQQAPAPAAAVPPAPATANAGLSTLLSGWDD